MTQAEGLRGDELSSNTEGQAVLLPLPRLRQQTFERKERKHNRIRIRTRFKIPYKYKQ
jgi:hypothetical protein